jgi:predicted dehydrogenase
MERVLKIGIVGCGEIAMENLVAIQQSGNSQVVIAMDPQIDLAKSLAVKANAKPTDRFEEVLDKNDVDAIFICTPHYLHVPLGIQAAKRGKHLIMEKPIATKLNDARDLIRICNESNVKLAVAYIMRYEDNVRKAKEFIENGIIGKIVGIEIHWIADKPDTYWSGGFTGRAMTNWRASKLDSGGGILIMNCSHLFDYIDFIAGLNPVKYYSQYGAFLTDVEVEDYFFGVLRYSNGVMGSVIASSKMVGGRYPNEERGVRLYGEYGQIVVCDTDSLLVYTKKRDTDIKPDQWNRIPNSKNDLNKGTTKDEVTARTLFIREVADALLNDREPPISGRIAYRSLETCIKLYESSKLSPKRVRNINKNIEK